MCGIAGIWNTQKRAVRPERVASVTNRLAHRGPDGSGVFVDNDLGLGHRRLSIIDLAGSSQPMYSVDKNFTIVYNGELYNFQELREQLKSSGFVFQTSGDTEVILCAYQQWGIECLQRFRGMFAFAIWDKQKRELFLARDRFGIKPLSFYQDGEKLVFASEIQAFKGLGQSFDRSLSLEALDQYLYCGYIPAPKSIFNNIQKLPPAHYCLIQSPDAKIEFHRYWSPRFQIDSTLGLGEYDDALRSELQDSVKSHLVADVPVGAFLSGGIDSSVVVATMAEVSKEPIHAYTIGFNHSAYDERPITRESVKKVCVNYHESSLDLDLFNVLDRLVKHYGEPFADSSAVCTYQVTGVAAQSVKVMLSGDGGDELFAGYSHYAWMLAEFSKTFGKWQTMRLGVTDALRALGLLNERMTPLSAWIGRNGYFTHEERSALWGEGAKQPFTQSTFNFLKSRFSILNSVKKDNLLDTIQALDIQDYLPYNNLHKVDIASMCHGLEVRVPLLDHKLAEFAMRIPWGERIQCGAKERAQEAAMHGYVTKLPLRKLAESYFGTGFFDRKKMGFAMPIHTLLAEDENFQKVSEALVGSDSPLRNYFDAKVMQRLLEEHKQTQRNGLKLWSLLFLSKWLDWVNEAECL